MLYAVNHAVVTLLPLQTKQFIRPTMSSLNDDQRLHETVPSVQGAKLCRSGASKEGMIVTQMTIRILDLLVPAWLAERQLQPNTMHTMQSIRCTQHSTYTGLITLLMQKNVL